MSALTPDSPMALALAEARKGPRGANPLVGAVLTAPDGRVLHTGHHRGAGTAHAEADVLARAAEAGTDLAGATLWVTLEPCHHRGRTGPCSEAVAGSGIARLVYAAADTTETARGGAAAVAAAGIRVEGGTGAEEALLLNERWHRCAAEQRPFVTAKTAQTLDSRTAATDGTSRWITGPHARGHGHELRLRVDAVLVGTGTLLADDPQLTTRTPDGALAGRQPLRVVVGRRPVPADAAVRRAPGGAGELLVLAEHDPHRVLELLWERGVRHVLLEGGAALQGAFLAADLVDELVVHQAPTVLGDGTAAFAPIGVSTLAGARHWVWDETADPAVARVGDDLLLHLAPRPDREPPLPGQDRPAAAHPSTPVFTPVTRS